MDADIPVPSFEHAVIGILGLVGIPAILLTALGVLFVAHGWYSGIKLGFVAFKRARTLALQARVLPDRLSSSLAITTVVLVPIGQVLVIALCFLGGNYLALIFDSERSLAISSAISLHGLGFASPAVFVPYLQLDLFSGTYVIIACVTIAASYTRARRGEDVEGLALLLGAPAVILLVLALGSGVLILGFLIFALFIDLIMWSDSGQAGFLETIWTFVRIALPLLIGGTVCFLYASACRMGLASSQLVVQTLRGRTVS